MTNIPKLKEALGMMYSHRGDGIPTQYVNPDGPAALAYIEELEGANARFAGVLSQICNFTCDPGNEDGAFYASRLLARQALTKGPTDAK